MSWAGLVASAAVAATEDTTAVERRHARQRPDPRELARPALAFPLGALAISASLIALAPLAAWAMRADLDLLEPDLQALGRLRDRRRDARSCSTKHARPRRRRYRAGLARPHARALLGGRLSTGVIKAAGAFGLAAFAVSGLGHEWPGYLADTALLLLTTNLFNLLDLRPGRVEKALALLLAGICIGAATAYPVELLGVFIGPVLIGAALTLRERAMLGDAGANLAGAIAGVALIVALGDEARLIALAVVAALTIFGEFRSISAAIERIAPLRWLDRLGRLRE